jgi:hypothetical protein
MKKNSCRYLCGKGIEWAYRKYLNGKDGRFLSKK